MSLFFIQILNFTDKSVLFFLMIRRPPRSTLFPYRRSSDLDAGFLPHAFVNFLCLLGWNPKDDRERMSRQELMDAFTLEGINRSNAVVNFTDADPFDPKALWLNAETIRTMPADELADRLLPIVQGAGFDI